MKDAKQSSTVTKKMNPVQGVGFILFLIFMGLSVYGSFWVPKTWTLQQEIKDVTEESVLDPVTGEMQTRLVFIHKGKTQEFMAPVERSLSQLGGTTYLDDLNAGRVSASVMQENISDVGVNGEPVYKVLTLKSHKRFWSLLPAFVAIALSIIIRNPLIALFSGILSGAILLQKYDLTRDVFVDQLAQPRLASVILLYLILLGALLGIWSKTGAPKAFAEMMARRFVRGQRSAKFVAWLLGIVFHQGGTMSTVLVGTTVAPLADKEGVSHEELSYIVDSTASPIATIIPFNAWPSFVVGLIFVGGVDFLATNAQRLNFFYDSIKFSFYSLFAVSFTLLLAFDLLPHWIMGRGLVQAKKRADETGELNRPGSSPLNSKELSDPNLIPAGYVPHVMEFFTPILAIIGVSLWTYFYKGSANVAWGFGLGIFMAWLIAWSKGMKLSQLVAGLEVGFKGVVMGAIIIIMAVTIGQLAKEAGGGLFLVQLLGSEIPYWTLPVILQCFTMIISFSTGTSWGTYAVAFPLAMPLAYDVALFNELSNVYLFMALNFAAVLNGSVYGDQCSPISDTTILSAMTTGTDLMDHVKTQLVPASYAAGMAGLLWTAFALTC